MKFDYPKAAVAASEAAIMLKKENLVSVSEYNIAERHDGSLADRAFFLPDDYDWLIARDTQGLLCLVPLKKTD